MTKFIYVGEIVSILLNPASRNGVLMKTAFPSGFVIIKILINRVAGLSKKMPNTIYISVLMTL